MKRLQRWNLIFLAMVMLALIPSIASAQTENVHARNNTDKWAWVTVIGYVDHWYGGAYENIAAWCVPPHTLSKRGGFPVKIQSGRVEITEKDCAHPVLADMGWSNVPQSKAAEFHFSQYQNPHQPLRYRFTAYKVE